MGTSTRIQATAEHEADARTKLPPKVIEAIGEFVRSRRKIGRPISISHLTRATRLVAPDLDVTDAELANLIARELMHAGVAIDFDTNVLPGESWLAPDESGMRKGQQIKH